MKANGRLHELKQQQTALEAKLGNDYGLEEALGALVDKCYEAQVWVPRQHERVYSNIYSSNEYKLCARRM